VQGEREGRDVCSHNPVGHCSLSTSFKLWHHMIPHALQKKHIKKCKSQPKLVFTAISEQKILITYLKIRAQERKEWNKKVLTCSVLLLEKCVHGMRNRVYPLFFSSIQPGDCTRNNFFRQN